MVFMNAVKGYFVNDSCHAFGPQVQNKRQYSLTVSVGRSFCQQPLDG